MMNCKWVEDHLSDYIDAELDSSSSEQVDAHVACCEHCRKSLSGYRSMGAWMKASEPIADTEAIWHRITCQFESPSTTIVRGLPSLEAARGTPAIGAPQGSFSKRPNVPWPPLLMVLAATFAFLFFAIRPLSERVWDRHGAAHVRHELAVDFTDILQLAGAEPKQAMDVLIDRYDGKEMGQEETEQALGFEPTLFQTIPDGYKLVSTHVLNMPCCICSATLCQREDGMTLIVLEHREDQAVWFGDAPSIQTQCGGRSCKIVESTGHLAISWQNENHHFTLLGATDLTEVSRWIESISL